MGQVKAGIFMLKEMKDKLPPSERKIAQYILENPEKAINMTATDLGKESETSSAAVIRLCKSLNLKGFQELKIRIVGDLNKKEVIEFRDIESNEPVSSIIDKVTTNSTQTIQETAELLDNNSLNEAVNFLLNGKRVHFFGVGASSIPAIDAHQKFSRINYNASVFTDLHMAATVVANATEDDVVVGISFSGETHEVAKVLELANSKGAKTISLTKYGRSTVADQADVSLYTSATKEATFRSGATSSRLAQLHVIDILFMCVASRSYEQTVNYLDSTRDAIKNLNQKVKKKK
ncbi:MurR/RpiR family transcriptional regulator [Piscibacillus sp. B03]|uniref:MurR/RpiR family transcriptional regulator n=1 Tax=Piscibacillus sp. B03 TaxID=3457430 RepID=UPI003FCE021B